MLPTKESLIVEFKSDQPPLSDHVLVDEAVAMANAEGGVIYLGVENDGTPSGVDALHRDVLGIVPLIANKTLPALYVEAEKILVNGRTVIAISVPKKNVIVSTNVGRTIRRALKGNGEPEIRPFFPWEFASRLSDIGSIDRSADLVRPYDESLLDMVSCRNLFRDLSEKNTTDIAIIGSDFEEFLLATRCVSVVGGVKMLTFAGLLLFGTDEALARYAPTAQFRFQWMERGEVRMNNEIRMNVCKAFEYLASFLAPLNPNREFFYQMRRIDVPRFALDAVREAFSNAIAHRDYSILSAIRVLIDETGLTIASPGPFIYGLTEKDLLSAEPHGRNPALSYALKLLGVAESSGRGVDKIYASAAKYGKAVPEYRLIGNDVVVFFPDSSIDVPFAQLMYPQRLSLLAVIVLALIRKHGPLPRLLIGTALGLGEAKVEGIIESLKGQHLVNEEQGKVSLTLPNAPAETGISLNEIKSRIIELANKRGGSFTREDVENEFLLSTSKAYRLIQTLVRNGFIVISSHGKHAKYRLDES